MGKDLARRSTRHNRIVDIRFVRLARAVDSRANSQAAESESPLMKEWSAHAPSLMMSQPIKIQACRRFQCCGELRIAGGPPSGVLVKSPSEMEEAVKTKLEPWCREVPQEVQERKATPNSSAATVDNKLLVRIGSDTGSRDRQRPSLALKHRSENE